MFCLFSNHPQNIRVMWNTPYSIYFFEDSVASIPDMLFLSCDFCEFVKLMGDSQLPWLFLSQRCRNRTSCRKHLCTSLALCSHSAAVKNRYIGLSRLLHIHNSDFGIILHFLLRLGSVHKKKARESSEFLSGIKS